MAALTVAELQTLRDSLVRNRANGIREFRDQNGETVTYKSDRELAAAIDSLEFEIGRMTAARPLTYIVRTSKGL